MENFHAIPYLQEIIIVLVTAGVLVPLFNRMHVSPVLGYLAVGLMAGPYGLASLHDNAGGVFDYVSMGHTKQIAHLAEFGVVFLLFMIGLELSPKRLWNMRKMVFGLGASQVVLCTAIIGGVALAFGNTLTASFVLGACFALSSTAIVMQILMDRQQLSTPVGRASFSILLFQDLAVVPILIFLDIYGGAGAHSVGMAVAVALAKAVGMIVTLVLAGHYVLRPVFRIAGASQSAEPFMAVTLLTVILAATMTGMAGLSMALGAFLGGLLLAETEYRHAIETYIEPFKGLLLGLFFMTVGMGIDLRALAQDPLWLISSVFGLILIKAAVTAPLARFFGLSWRKAFETGLLLGQGGEFAFVIVGSAMTLQILPRDVGQFMLIVTGLSMIVTPGVAYLSQRASAHFKKRQASAAAHDQAPDDIPDMHGHVIVAGAGRVGRTIIRVLQAEAVPYIAIDNNMDVVAEKRKLGKKVFYGDASRHELLKHFSPDKAQAIVLTMDDAHATSNAIASIRRFCPDVPVFARARDKRIARVLHKSGASHVVAETVEASMQLCSGLLKNIGFDEDLILRRLDIERHNALLGMTGE